MSRKSSKSPASSSVVALGLVLHVLPLAVNIVAADRFLYLPLSPGLALALDPRRGRGRRTAPAPHFAQQRSERCSPRSAVAAFVRAQEWTDEIDFGARPSASIAGRSGAAAWSSSATSATELACIGTPVGVYQGYRDAPDSNYGMVGNNLATSLQSLGQYRAARHVLRQVLVVFPATPKVRVSMAFAELSLGSFESAGREFDEALRLYPGYPVALGMKRRLPELRKAEETSPGDSAPALLERAKHSVEMGRTREAFKYIDRAIALGGLPRGEADGALLFAQRFADPPRPNASTAPTSQRSAGKRHPTAWPSPTGCAKVGQALAGALARARPGGRSSRDRGGARRRHSRPRQLDATAGMARRLVLSAIALGLGVDFAFWLRPGPFLIDEVTYDLMAKSAAEGRRFIWNGYEEPASRELESLQIRATLAA